MRDQLAEQPSSTAKHNAIIEQNRKNMEKKKSD